MVCADRNVQARTENYPFKDCNIYFRMDMDSEKQPFSEPQELEMEQEWCFLGASAYHLRRYLKRERDTEPQKMGIEKDEATFKWHIGTGLSSQKKVTNLSVESLLLLGSE